MASNTVNLGIGYSGMMYIADVGQSLPASPLDTLTGFTEVGAIDSDGITTRVSKPLESEGAVVDVYENYIDIRGIDLKNNLYLN